MFNNYNFGTGIVKKFDFEDEFNKTHNLGKYDDVYKPTIDIVKKYDFEDEFNKTHKLGKYDSIYKPLKI